MNQTLSKNLSRGIFLLLIQGLLLRGIQLGWGHLAFIQIFLYPLFLLMLPIKIPKALAIVIGFIYGFAIDLFYQSPGLHTSASLITVFLRPLLLSYLEPRGGYKATAKPTKSDLGTAWFYRFIAIGMAIHLTGYFLVEVFSIREILTVILRVVFCFIASMILILLYTTIFNLKE